MYKRQVFVRGLPGRTFEACPTQAASTEAVKNRWDKAVIVVSEGFRSRARYVPTIFSDPIRARLRVPRCLQPRAELNARRVRRDWFP